MTRSSPLWVRLVIVLTVAAFPCRWNAADAEEIAEHEKAAVDAMMNAEIHAFSTAMEAFYAFNDNSYVAATVPALARYGFVPKRGVTAEILELTAEGYRIKVTAAGGTVAGWEFNSQTAKLIAASDQSDRRQQLSPVATPIVSRGPGWQEKTSARLQGGRRDDAQEGPSSSGRRPLDRSVSGGEMNKTVSGVGFFASADGLTLLLFLILTPVLVAAIAYHAARAEILTTIAAASAILAATLYALTPKALTPKTADALMIAGPFGPIFLTLLLCLFFSAVGVGCAVGSFTLVFSNRKAIRVRAGIQVLNLVLGMGMLLPLLFFAAMVGFGILMSMGGGMH